MCRTYVAWSSCRIKMELSTHEKKKKDKIHFFKYLSQRVNLTEHIWIIHKMSVLTFFCDISRNLYSHIGKTKKENLKISSQLFHLPPEFPQRNSRAISWLLNVVTSVDALLFLCYFTTKEKISHYKRYKFETRSRHHTSNNLHSCKATFIHSFLFYKFWQRANNSNIVTANFSGK